MMKSFRLRHPDGKYTYYSTLKAALWYKNAYKELDNEDCIVEKLVPTWEQI